MDHFSSRGVSQINDEYPLQGATGIQLPWKTAGAEGAQLSPGDVLHLTRSNQNFPSLGPDPVKLQWDFTGFLGFSWEFPKASAKAQQTQ